MPISRPDRADAKNLVFCGVENAERLIEAERWLPVPLRDPVANPVGVKELADGDQALPDVEGSSGEQGLPRGAACRRLLGEHLAEVIACHVPTLPGLARLAN